jgi:UDP-N-acetylmuramoylalanine--D-glutamate ligase
MTTRRNDPLRGKRVLVLGFARQGRALARWLPTVGALTTVSDSKNAEQLGINPKDYPTVDFIFNDTQETFPRYIDVVCVSGGVPLDTPLIQAARAAGVPITNDAQLFLERCPAQVIGITGSAGKTTTTTLTGEILKRHAAETGTTVWVGGNIGDVLLDVLPKIKPEDTVVMELSSFQLEIMTCSPQVAAVLNVTPNHLDRHKTMENYLNAKANILRYQPESGVAVLCLDDPGSLSMQEIINGRMVGFSLREMMSDGAFMVGERLIVAGDCSPDGDPHVVIERGEIQLRGDHNVTNVLAACAITGSVGVPPETMAAVIREFKGVAHRLEVVRQIGGVTYVNDSIATAPERVVAALRSFDEPLVLLLGGKDKDLPWDAMLRLALTKARHIITFGHAGDMILERLMALRVRDGVTRVNTLDEAVSMASKIAQAGDVVLLSPGGTSYDAYTDFAERGEHFRRLVEAL